MRKIPSLIFGLLVGFAIVWANQNLDFGRTFANLTINHQTADFFSKFFSTQKESELAVIMLYASSKAFIICVPLGALIGLVATKIINERIFLYSIVFWPVQHIFGILIVRKLSAGTACKIIVTAQKEGHAFDILSIFIAYLILYIAIFTTFKLLNKKQPNKLINRTENTSALN